MARIVRRSTSIAFAAVLTGSVVVSAATSSSAVTSPHPDHSFRIAGTVSATSVITVNVALPLRHKAALEALTIAQGTPGSASFHKWLSPQTFRQRYGVTDAQLRSLQHSLAAQHLVVTAQGAQAVAVTGTATNVARAFRTSFEKVVNKGGTVRTASKTVMTAPKAVAAMHGTPISITPAIRMHSLAVRSTAKPDNRYGAYGGYWFDDLKQAYQYPAYGKPSSGKASGTGTTIGILMSPAPSPNDIAAYFGHEHLATPKVSIENVLGGAPFDPNGGSLEADLDVQQSAGMAPNANIVFYNVPDLSDSSVFAGYVAIDEENAVDVVNSSFGECELFYTAAYNGGISYTGILNAYHDLFLQGNAQGITFVASSGDNGGLECTNAGYVTGQKTGNTFAVGVSTPAADPAVTAVGGTNLTTTYAKNSLASRRVSENATADVLVPYDPYGIGANVAGGFWGSGGGFSTIFAEPSWQRANTPNSTGKRSVPDVSLHMGGCPGGISQFCGPEDSSVTEVYAGQIVGVIGTSASAPDFAGTVALYDEVHKSRAGNINPLLYSLGNAQRRGKLAYQVFHESIPGDNGHYVTAFTASGGRYGGYDEVLGNGTLVAKNFIFGKSTTPAAGNPQTPSNP